MYPPVEGKNISNYFYTTKKFLKIQSVYTPDLTLCPFLPALRSCSVWSSRTQPIRRRSPGWRKNETSTQRLWSSMSLRATSERPPPHPPLTPAPPAPRHARWLRPQWNLRPALQWPLRLQAVPPRALPPWPPAWGFNPSTASKTPVLKLKLLLQ